MLVYIDEGQWNRIFEPVKESEVPKWIHHKEQELWKKNELKNYIQIPLLTFSSFQELPCSEQALRNGLLYHKNAINSDIDHEQLEIEVKKHSLEVLLPKSFTQEQTYAYLSQIVRSNSYKVFCRGVVATAFPV